MNESPSLREIAEYMHREFAMTETAPPSATIGLPAQGYCAIVKAIEVMAIKLDALDQKLKVM